ncbi:Protein of unknown function DUF1592 [Pirellula staleyi DSM 6068]|uniref:Cytochrome c domain-containing protein n=1 Tax=Pirellula staleyi (strain ATCC 27377 / DSM 6068 / ICPB 4128) TaxID=530564 RepID=D2QYK5_PIRSD|nr:DUF1592 domain-containing protein [Pirellula staleyi]ADB18164.1 Protein of unknown function DUF1592 [Pirellula staleyi DSM 6068]
MKYALRFALILWVTVAAILSEPSVAGEPPRATIPASHHQVLRAHCQKCHAKSKAEGAFRIDDLPLTITTLETAERWQKILNALNSGEMPPEGEKQLENEVKADLLDQLANTMVAARKTLADQGGVITMRRLNRREYRNSLRELLGVEINVSELPSDVGSGGFDTVGSNLFMSGNQFEQYLALGREGLDEAWERQAAATSQHKLRQEGEQTTPLLRKLHADELDARRRGDLWVKGVDEAAARSENAAIVAELRKEFPDESIFRRSWAKIPGAPSPESFGFQTGENNADKANRASRNFFLHAYHAKYLAQPAVDRGAYLTINNGGDFNSWLTLNVPFSWPVGEYVVRIRAAHTEHATPERRFIEFGIHPRHGQVISTHEVTGTMDHPQVIEIPLVMTRKHSDRNDRAIFIREKGTSDHIEQSRRRFNEGVKENGVGPEFVLWIDWMEIERVNDASGKLPAGIATLQIGLDDKSNPSPDEVRQAIERFAVEAFRGKAPSTTYLDRLAEIYQRRRTAGDKHAAALKESLSVVLASPMFLYLAEPTPDQQRRALTSQELATRLSYFLWGSPPDRELRELAQQGKLLEPETLSAQSKRLLSDPRAVGFSRPFVHQWLELDRVDFFTVNRAMFPRFDEATKLAARSEVYETFEHILRANAGLDDLLRSDYVVIDGVLANYYGIENVHGDEFRKVPVPADSPRGGLLGMAAINFMLSNGERTSPVERGAWVLRKLLNDPPPPAPANVPQLARLAGKLLTTRERLSLHQEQAQCASCHRKIDPIGLGLENLDATGMWRTDDSYQLFGDHGKPISGQKISWKIEPQGKLFQGPEFADYYQLREILASKSEDFARGFSMALIEYALGRPCSFSDEPLIEAMVNQAREKDFAVQSFLETLVTSEAFRLKS